jgi:hypothetical protein
LDEVSVNGSAAKAAVLSKASMAAESVIFFIWNPPVLALQCC